MDAIGKIRVGMIAACIILILIEASFFRLAWIQVPGSIAKLILFTLFIWGLRTKRKLELKKGMMLMLLFLVISCIVSNIYRNQNVIRTLLASSVSAGLLLYFFFHKIQLSNNENEKIIIFLALLYCSGYILQLFIKPTMIFLMDDSMMGDSSRLRLPGSAVATLGYFVFLNRYFEKKKLIDVFFVAVIFFTILMMGFRTIIAAILICTVLYMLLQVFHGRINPKTLLQGSFLVVVVFLVFNTDIGRNVLGEMLERNETDNFSNKDYVRYLSFENYWNYYMLPIEKVLGLGSAYEGSPNEFDIIHQRIGNGAVWVDWGIVGLSFYNGAITIAIQVFCIVKMMLKRISPQYAYLRVWLLFMLLCSVTSGEYIRTGNTCVIALVLYWIEINTKKNDTSIGNHHKLQYPATNKRLHQFNLSKHSKLKL